MKKFITVCAIICCIAYGLLLCNGVYGYITAPDFPEEDDDYIWVSAYPYSYIYWDEKSDCFVGILHYNGREFNCGVRFEDSMAHFFNPEQNFREAECSYEIDSFYMPGTFGDDMFILKADNEEELDRNSPTLTFVRYNRNEYEKEHGAIKEFIR